jgi:4-amino-4-deoxy-L-arabinose transferase-like glycosyltransferase
MVRRGFSTFWFGIGGAILILIAALVSNSEVERVFGRTAHSLAWGPELFRILLAIHGCILLAAGFFGQKDSATPARSFPGATPRAWTVLGVIIAIAIVLRIPGLNSCLWLDEVLTMARFARPPLTTIFTSFPDQNQHMLYSLLAHCSLLIFGEQAWALRLPSVMFGALSIWALFLLGRRLIGDTEALIACGLMAVSYHHIWFSQNARGYMGLLFFTNIATWLWLRCLDTNRWNDWLAYTASIVLGFWIHMSMLFVVATHAIVFLVVWLRSDRQPVKLGRAVAAFALCGTLVLQLHALALPEFFRTAVGEFSPASEWTSPLWVVTESLRSLRVGFAGVAVVIFALVLTGAGWIDILRREARAAWAMILPGVLGGGSMLALGHNLWPRFFFFCMGFALLTAIHGAMRLPQVMASLLKSGANWSTKAGYALAGLMIAASITTIPRVYALPKQDFTGARDYVEHQLVPGDTVATAGLAAHAYSDYYAPNWTVVQTGDELIALTRKGKRTFLVYTLPVDMRAAHPDIWKILQNDFETVKIFPGTLGGGEVYVCRAREGLAFK